jgi:hypothetical protein
LPGFYNGCGCRSGAFAANILDLAALVADPAMAGEHGTKDVLRRLFHFSAGFRREVVLQFALEIAAGLLSRGRLHRSLNWGLRRPRKLLPTPPGTCFAFFFSVIYRHFDPPTTDIQIF